jgi:hypothetical protein
VPCPPWRPRPPHRRRCPPTPLCHLCIPNPCPVKLGGALLSRDGTDSYEGAPGGRRREGEWAWGRGLVREQQEVGASAWGLSWGGGWQRGGGSGHHGAAAGEQRCERAMPTRCERYQTERRAQSRDAASDASVQSSGAPTSLTGAKMACTQSISSTSPSYMASSTAAPRHRT